VTCRFVVRRVAVPMSGATAFAIAVGVLAAQTRASTASASQQATSADTVPTAPQALFDYLQAGRYKSFTHESAAHSSRGEHLVTVIAYFNAILHSSMTAGNTAHPRGAAAIIEMLDEDDALTGWGVSVKTHAASLDGKGWFWYEVLRTADAESPTAANWGVSSCLGCHTSGRDFVLSNYPLR